MRKRYRLAIGVTLGMSALVLATKDDARSGEIVAPAATPHATTPELPQPAPAVTTAMVSEVVAQQPSVRGP